MKSKNEESYGKSKHRLRTDFILITTAIMVLVVAITILLEWAIMNTGWVDAMFQQPAWIFASISIGFTSVFTGIGLSFLANRIVMRPINDLLDGMSKLADGKYDTRISYKGAVDVRRVYDGFNALAQELQGVEILRSDFINNFSHEFKTPMNSMSGLVGLLKEKELPRKKQLEYLGVIEDEIGRLSLMTTNILNLTKLENQGILTNTTSFNVSEQIRICVLLAEKQWTQKQLELSMDFDDFDIVGDEDMLKQVWINLIDNAVKYSNEKGRFAIDVKRADDKLLVEISNDGIEIPQEEREKIFNKFYRIDSAYSSQGNGIGLPMVKRIVELHGGSVSTDRRDGMTVFAVSLPI